VNGIWRGAAAAFEHAVSTFLHRQRTYVAAAMLILPAFLPLLVRVLPHDHEHDFESARGWVMTQMIEIFYITGATPLLALFFAAMLVGEDVETQTISYVLTRSIPRSAWIIGRFAAYLAITSGIVLISMLILSVTVLALPPGGEVVGAALLAKYQLIATLSLLAYGALCAFLGALFRHPVVVGVLLIFGWQQIAMLAPGATNFLTISKFVSSLLPKSGPGMRRLMDELTSELLNPSLSVGPWTAGFVLVAIGMACLALATAVVRSKEYTTPVAVSE
jgi:ABC-type transport system involved in multi-copper enzyme maturation permease subunit